MAAFGPDIGVALAGLASQPQLPPTSAAHKKNKKLQKALRFGHFALAIQQTLIYAGGGGSGERGRGPQPPERLCACQVSLRPHFSFTTLLLAAIFFTTLYFFYHPPAGRYFFLPPSRLWP